MDTNIKQLTLVALNYIHNVVDYGHPSFSADTFTKAWELVKDAINQLPDPGRTIIRLDVPTSWAESDEGREALDNLRHLQEELDDAYEE